MNEEKYTLRTILIPRETLQRSNYLYLSNYLYIYIKLLSFIYISLYFCLMSYVFMYWPWDSHCLSPHGVIPAVKYSN